MGTGAGVRAFAKGQVSFCAALKVETIGLGKLSRVTIGGGQQQGHLLAFGDGGRPDLDWIQGHPEDGSGWPGKAKQLFDPRRDPVLVGAELPLEAGIG